MNSSENPQDLTTLIADIQRKSARNISIFNGQFPNYGTGLQYVLKGNETWLAGFWSGLLWLCAAAGDDPQFRDAATTLLPSFQRGLDEKIHIDHDFGFLYLLSARAQWEMEQDEVAKQLGLLAAERLLERFRLPGRYIQAWGPIGDPDEGGRIIADTMMNLPLLFWATEVTGERHFYDAAFQHAKHSQTLLVRPDGSTYHTYFFNQTTGEPDYPETHQGHGDDSLWSRGQAWMIYGFALAAQWTGDASFLATAKTMARCFLAELPADKVPHWDLRLPSDEIHARDSSASAIAACGLFRIAQLSDDPTFKASGIELINALLTHCLETDPDGQGLIKHGALHIPKGWAPDDYLIFGDYFFMEALLTLTGKNPDFWGPTKR